MKALISLYGTVRTVAIFATAVTLGYWHGRTGRQDLAWLVPGLKEYLAGKANQAAQDNKNEG